METLIPRITGAGSSASGSGHRRTELYSRNQVRAVFPLQIFVVGGILTPDTHATMSNFETDLLCIFINRLADGGHFLSWLESSASLVEVLGYNDGHNLSFYAEKSVD